MAERSAVESNAEFLQMRIRFDADSNGIGVDAEALPEAFVEEASKFGGGGGFRGTPHGKEERRGGGGGFGMRGQETKRGSQRGGGRGGTRGS